MAVELLPAKVRRCPGDRGIAADWNVLPDGLRLIVTAEQLSVAVAMPGSTVVSQVVAPGTRVGGHSCRYQRECWTSGVHNCKYNGRSSSVAGSVIVAWSRHLP